MTKFSPFEFTSKIGQLLLESDISGAYSLVQNVIDEGKLDKNNYRVKFALNLIESVTKHLLEIDELAKADDRVRVIELHNVRAPKQLGIPEIVSPKLEDGIYINILNNYLIANTLNPILLDKGFDLQSLEVSGFNKQLKSIDVDKLYVDSNVRLSCLSSDAMTVFTEDGKYHLDVSGRVAKASNRNAFIQHNGDVLDEAYILPFPHSIANYYHSLCEIGYGLRHINRISDTVPIVYMQDRFGIVETFRNMLGIDHSRMIEIGELKTYLIKKAYIPNVCPFYWSSNMTDFFRNSVLSSIEYQNKTNLKKLYISRSKSSRSPVYEKKLEKLLEDIGYHIVHTQDLSFENQVKVFSQAEEIITHHGAGLANFIFSKNDIKVYEIFINSFLAPDFYHRSKSITPYYRPVFGMNESNCSCLIEHL